MRTCKMKSQFVHSLSLVAALVLFVPCCSLDSLGTCFHIHSLLKRAGTVSPSLLRSLKGGGNSALLGPPHIAHSCLHSRTTGSPLDPAQHRNPFQYIDYNMDARSQQQSGAGRAGQGPKPRLSMPGGLSPKPLMGMAAGARSRRLSDIESLIGVMDKEAAQVIRLYFTLC